MKRIAQEAEVIARLDFLTNETHITVVSWPAMARRMKRLYGEPFDARGQVQRWKVEGLPVTFRKPHRYAVLVPAGALNRGLSKLSAATRGLPRENGQPV